MSSASAPLSPRSTAKLVYRPAGVSELYDLQGDPRELHNLIDADSHAGLRAELLAEMMAWLVRTGDVPPLRNDARGMPDYPRPISDGDCRSVLQPDPSGPGSNGTASRAVAGGAWDLMTINGIPHFDV